MMQIEQRRKRCVRKRKTDIGPVTGMRSRHWIGLISLWLLLSLLLAACTPSPEMNVFGYWVSSRLGTLSPVDPSGPSGTLTGQVVDGDRPIAGASVVVAERTGRPHAAVTDEAGRYRIDGVPVGQYVPAAIAPGYDEAAALDSLGVPRLVTIKEGVETEAPLLALQPRVTVGLSDDLATAVQLELTGSYTSTAPFPEDSVAQVLTFRFERDGVVNDTLRLYLPLGTTDSQELNSEELGSELLRGGLPLLFFSYPGVVDGWEQVSVAFASQGYGLVAHSPVSDWGIDVDEHAMDARIALTLAKAGALGPFFQDSPAVALGAASAAAFSTDSYATWGETISAPG